MSGRIAGRVASLWLALVAALWTGPGHATEAELLPFDALEGWAQDDHGAALSAFLRSCARLADPEWTSVCAFAAQTQPDPTAFFERFFRPVQIGNSEQMLFTGYFEPEIAASATRRSGFTTPVYRVPGDLQPGQPYLTRGQIDAGALAGRGLEIAWLSSPAELYYLQKQGSGRLVLGNGRVLRLGFGAQNGQPRRVVSSEFVQRGLLGAHQVSAPVIRSWVQRNPDRGREILNTDPSYVFFRELDGHDPALGPLGALNLALTPMRSLAVDPTFTPLGAPVWIERGGMRRLMVAQDTGGAIRGPQRADIFFGTGDGAGQAARQVRDGGRMVVLLPIELAYSRLIGH